MSVYNNYTTFPQLLYPTAAAGVAVTPNGTAYADSNYSEIHAGFAFPIAIVGLLVNSTTIVAEYRVDVATGASSSEVVKGTLINRVESATGLGFLEFKTPLQIPASTRIAIKMRHSGTDTTNWTFKIVYYAIEGTTYDIAANLTATADFTVAPNVVHNGVVNLTVTADFSVSGVIITPPGGGGVPTSLPVRGTLYLRKRRF